MTKTLLILRGLPGSGKSTFAKELCAATGAVHAEADMYFEKAGQYSFQPNQLHDAHRYCQLLCENAMKLGKDVIVSNTFTRRWEMEFYIRLAATYGYDVQIKTMTGNYKNIHSVPDSVIEKMRARFED